MHGYQEFTLFILGVNSLGDCDDPDSEMLQAVMYIDNISKGPAETRSIVNHQDVEVAILTNSIGHQSLETLSIIADAGHAVILICPDFYPSVKSGPLPALPELIIDRVR
jgi:hypothetical protein